MDPISGSSFLNNPRSDFATRAEQRFERRTEFLENAGHADRAQKIAQRGEKIVEQVNTREPREILEPLTNPRVTQAIGRVLDHRSEIASYHGYRGLSALISERAERLENVSDRASQAMDFLDTRSQRQQDVGEIRNAVQSYMDTERVKG